MHIDEHLKIIRRSYTTCSYMDLKLNVVFR
jgi:hypothetical protein